MRGSRRPSRPLSLRRPRPERDEGSAWPLVDLCEPVERSYGVALQWCGVCPACWTVSTSHARTPVRPTQRAMRPRRQRSTKQLGPKLQALAAEHPDQRLQLWGEEEARIGETRAPHPGLVRARHAPARKLSISTTRAFPCSPPPGPALTRRSPWLYRGRMRARWMCSSTPSPVSWHRTGTPYCS